MNIYIYNCSNTFNYGSMMMGENFINYFNQISGVNNKYYVETREQINIDRLKEATGINEIYPSNIDSLFKEGTVKYDYIYAYLKFKKVISDNTKGIDLVVVLGGDDFTEDYGWRGPLVNAIKFNLLKREGLRVVMLGQTMGPYHSFRKLIMKKLLQSIDKIYPRDPITYSYLKKFGLRNISLTDDLALLPLSKQKNQPKTKEYITYCPSELIYRYSKEGSRSEWINYNVFMIDTIMNRYPDKRLVLLAHVLKPQEVDDRAIVNELYELIKDKYAERIILVNNIILPYEVREYIQKSLFTISSRMHPTVSSIQCEVPIIALSYSTKYWGILGERYNLKDYILDVRHLDYCDMKDKFINTVDKIEKEYDCIQENMRQKNYKAKESIMKTLNEIMTLSDH